MTFTVLSGPLLLVLAQTPEPSPSEPVHTIYTVTPGISGFIAFFVLALVGWLLFRSLIKHIRRVDQEVLRRERAAEEPEPSVDGGPAAGVEQRVASGDEPGEGPGR